MPLRRTAWDNCIGEIKRVGASLDVLTLPPFLCFHHRLRDQQPPCCSSPTNKNLVEILFFLKIKCLCVRVCVCACLTSKHLKSCPPKLGKLWTVQSGAQVPHQVSLAFSAKSQKVNAPASPHPSHINGKLLFIDSSDFRPLCRVFLSVS